LTEKKFIEEINEIIKEIYSINKRLLKIFTFEDPFYCLIVFIELYILWKISKIINDKIFLLIVGNIIIFYSNIEKRYPKFLFRTRMFIKEIIEGILGIFIAFVPKYEEKQDTKKTIM